jgi:hypothetical protein
MREFMNLIKSINIVEDEETPVSVEAPTEKKKTLTEKIQEAKPAPVRKVAPRVMEQKAKPVAKAKPKPVSEAYKSHPEYNLLSEIVKKHGKNGPEYGSVDFFMAEAYVRGLSEDTGVSKEAIMREAYAEYFDQPTREERQRERQLEKIRAEIADKRAQLIDLQARKAIIDDPIKQAIDDVPLAKPLPAPSNDRAVLLNQKVAETQMDNPWGIEFTISEDADVPQDDGLESEETEDVDDGLEPETVEEQISESVLEETVNVWSTDGDWYYSLSRDGNIIMTSNRFFDEDECRREAEEAEKSLVKSRGPDNFGGSPFEYNLNEVAAVGFEIWREGDIVVEDCGSEFVVTKQDIRQEGFADKEGAVAWAQYLLSGESDVSTVLTEAPAEIQDAEILAEAKKFAQLAGIGAPPKKIEMTDDIADMMALAGIRR